MTKWTIGNLDSGLKTFIKKEQFQEAVKWLTSIEETWVSRQVRGYGLLRRAEIYRQNLKMYEPARRTTMR